MSDQSNEINSEQMTIPKSDKIYYTRERNNVKDDDTDEYDWSDPKINILGTQTVQNIWMLSIEIDDGMQGVSHTVGLYDSEEALQDAKTLIITETSATEDFPNGYTFRYNNTYERGSFVIKKFQMNDIIKPFH